MRRHVELVFGGGFDGALDGLVELAWTDPVTGSLRHAQLFGTDQLEELVDRAAELNRIERCNVYVGAALRKLETPTTKRTADDDFHSAPFAWADIDLDRVDAAVRMTKAAGLPPTMTVITGRHPHTRAQLWWRLVDAERDGAAIKALCAQLERCERAWGLFDAGAVEGSANAASSAKRPGGPGAPPKHDWDAFASAIARRVHDHGMPVSQGELVRDVMDWFAGREDFPPPDERTVRRKVSAIWKVLHS